MNKLFLVLILLLFLNCERKSSSLYYQVPCKSSSEILNNIEQSGLKILKHNNENIEIQYPSEPSKSAVISIGEYDTFNNICNVYLLSTKYQGLSFDEVNIEDMNENEKEVVKDKFATEILGGLFKPQ